MKRIFILAPLILAACAPHQTDRIENASVQLAFEGDLKNIGYAELVAEVHDGKARFKSGNTGKALYPLGDGSWIEYQTADIIEVGEKTSISFDFKPADWDNPYGAGSATKTIVVISGRNPERIQHIAFNVTKGDKPNLEVSFEDAGRERRRLSSKSDKFHNRWRSVRLDVDRSARKTALYLDGALIASVDEAPAALDNGISVLKFGTWHKKNQAYRGYVDNFVIADFEAP